MNSGDSSDVRFGGSPGAGAGAGPATSVAAARAAARSGAPADPDRDPLLADLTGPQREAVLHVEGPLLILAAAGSGKTRVITRRIAHLVRIGVKPWQIMALTFTNKAAGEMRARVVDLLGAGEDGQPPRGLTVTTFHSLCARLLRRYAVIAELPGLRQDYTIYDTSDQTALMKRVIAELGLSTTNWPPRSILSAISNAKNEMKDATAFAAEAGDFHARTIAKIFTAYEKALRRANAVDFDDLLLLTVRVLQTCQQARDEAQQRWRHLMIDEYQDTNRAQFVLATLLVGNGGESGGPNICVVGDPDQSIYGWRGADIRNILEFEQHWPDAHVIALGQNFRSTAPILGVADALIRNNKLRKHKDLFTTRPGGEKPEVILCRDEHHEADVVIDWVKKRREEGAQWKDMAVFYRMNALSRVMEDAMRRSGVPHVIARGTAFYEREEVKDALAYLRVVANPADDVSLRRIINKPTRGVGAATIAAVESLGAQRGLTLFDALRVVAQGGGSGGDLSARAINAIAKFIELIDSWTGHGSFMGGDVSGSLSELVGRVVKESGLEKLYNAKKAKSAEAGAESPDEDRLANLEEIISAAHEFEMEYDAESDPANDVAAGAEGRAPAPALLAMLRGYLESVSLVSDADKVDPAQGAVTLMTLHAAKGLEFGAVAMIGLEDGLLPHARSRESEAELEEERRLCFVGVTRAMERLLVTSARYRTHRGMRERAIPSQFLEEFPGEHIAFSDQSEPEWGGEWDTPSAGYSSGGGMSRPFAGGGPPGMQQRDWTAPSEDESRHSDDFEPVEMLPVGALVRHPQFGVGKVKSINAAGANARASIEFKGIGAKTLVLRYARLERIG